MKMCCCLSSLVQYSHHQDQSDCAIQAHLDRARKESHIFMILPVSAVAIIQVSPPLY